MQRLLREARAELISLKGYAYILSALYLTIPATYVLTDEYDLLDYSGFEMSTIGYLLIIAAQIAGVVFGTALFAECHRSENADIAFSLPTSAKRRFALKLFLNTAFTVLPFIIAMVGMAVITLLSADKIGGSFWGDWACVLINGLAGVLFVNAFTFLCSVFTSTRAGAMAASVIGIIMSAYLPLFVFAYILTCAHINTVNYLPDSLFLTGFGRMTTLYHTSGETGEVISGLISLLLSGVCMLTAFAAYLKRDRKSIFVNPPAMSFMHFYLFICMSAACIYTSVETGFIGVIIAVPLCIVMYAGLLKLKDYDSGFILRRSIAFAVSGVLLVTFMITSLLTKSFGYTYVLDDDECKGVYMTISVNNMIPLDEKPVETLAAANLLYENDMKMEITDPSQIEEVYKVLESLEKDSGYKPRVAEHMLTGIEDEDIYMQELLDEPSYPEIDVYIIDSGTNCEMVYSFYYCDYDDMGRLVTELESVGEHSGSKFIYEPR